MVLGWVDVFGYAASSLTLATFAQRSMLPMRWLALCANVCFIAYGTLGMYMPVLVLHLVLLPINLVRLHALTVERTAGAKKQGTVSISSPPGLSSGLIA
jgi:hypothetical protein